MVEYQITFARSARKEIERLESNLVARIWKRIESLSKAPRPQGARKLVGSNDLWRLRVGDYRVVYAIDDNARKVDIITIRHRKDAYRGSF